MIVIDIEKFSVEIKNGSLKNVGGTEKYASVKIFDVEETEARRFGKDRIEICFEDGENNQIQAAISNDLAEVLAKKINTIFEDVPIK
jgi:hypothetical protein